MNMNTEQTRFMEFACPAAQEELQVRYPKDLDLKSFTSFLGLCKL